MATSSNTRKISNQRERNKKVTPIAVPPKEEVGRWESEGGAPQGGRNPTAIKEGQGAAPQPGQAKKVQNQSRADSAPAGRNRTKR